MAARRARKPAQRACRKCRWPICSVDEIGHRLAADLSRATAIRDNEPEGGIWGAFGYMSAAACSAIGLAFGYCFPCWCDAQHLIVALQHAAGGGRW